MVYTRNYSAPPVNKKEILRYLGAREENKELLSLIDECFLEVEGKLSYRVCFSEFPIFLANGEVDLGFCRSSSLPLQKNLNGCSSVVLFAATVGIELDRQISRFSAVLPAKAVVLHAIGNERIESLCDAFCRDIATEKAKQGFVTCPRFSPGYGEFSLEAQRNIFSVLDCPKNVGITLNESLFMTPSKSVTAVIGVKENK